MVHYLKYYKIQVNSNECYTFPKRKLILSPSVLQSVKLYRVHNGLKSFLESSSDFFVNFSFRGTGKSLSEALIFESTNQQYDDRLFIELQV